jgi:hypothetical protein
MNNPPNISWEGLFNRKGEEDELAVHIILRIIIK